MGLAKEERRMAQQGEGCLGKAADDEPVFILRAKDVTAPEAVENWIGLVMKHSYQAGASNPRRDNQKLKEAQALAHQMRAWQALNGCKVPD